MIYFKKLSDNAKLPTRATDGSAGFDLSYIGYPRVLQSGCHDVFDTGITMQIDQGKVGIIKPRSGLAVKYGIDILAGVIDSDYRGELKVVLVNHGKQDFRIEEGYRIAQLIVVDYEHRSHEVTTTDDTLRGTGGFGSTGK